MDEPLFQDLADEVKKIIQPEENYTVSDLASLSLSIYKTKYGIHDNMPQTGTFAWPYVAFLHEMQIHDKPFCHKTVDKNTLLPAWKGKQWVTGEVISLAKANELQKTKTNVDFQSIIMEVKKIIQLNEVYTLPEMAMLCLQMYRLHYGVHVDMPELSRFARPFSDFLRKQNIHNTPYGFKQNHDGVRLPAWKGQQFLSGKGLKSHQGLVLTIFEPLASKLKSTKSLKIEDIPFLFGLYDLLHLQKQTKFPFNKIARYLDKHHPNERLIQEFGIRRIGVRYLGLFPKFNFHLSDPIKAFINTQKIQGKYCETILHGSGIYFMKPFFKKLTPTPTQLKASLKINAKTRFTKGIWQDPISNELLIDVAVFRKFHADLILKEGQPNHDT